MSERARLQDAVANTQRQNTFVSELIVAEVVQDPEVPVMTATEAALEAFVLNWEVGT